MSSNITEVKGPIIFIAELILLLAGASSGFTLSSWIGRKGNMQA